MKAHVIAFENPTARIYKKLPPSVEDLEEVLAILFTGPHHPNATTYKRTPFLVRKNVVVNALKWLKLNHVDYQDIEIDYKAMKSYPDDVPPVTVQYRNMESNQNTESMSVFDQEVEDGVDSGPCPFTVHGITGEAANTLSLEASKLVALEHLNTGGKVLAVRHGDAAINVYTKDNIYAQMF
ncbi:hypothetical protein BDN72DRAFT_776817, partial [Pluteus cervinus]